MKKFFVPFLVLVFIFTVIDDASAQRRGKKKRRKKEDTEETSKDERDFEGVSFADKLNIEIKPGNLNFFGNQLSLSLKTNAGYKFNKTLSAGLGTKLFYDYINQFGSTSDISALSYGGLLYGRVKVTQTFYIQGEYNVVSFGAVSTTPQETLFYPTAGIGYIQQGFDWSFGLELLAILNDQVRDKPQGNIVEYWINFSKNF